MPFDKELWSKGILLGLEKVKKKIELCEIIPNINPYKVSGEEFYKEVDKYETVELGQMVNHCNEAVSEIISTEKIATLNRFLTLERCSKIKEATNNFTKTFTSYKDYLDMLSIIGIPLIAIELPSEDLSAVCEQVLDIDKEKQKVCKIANNNALVLHYVINGRKGDVDINSGTTARKIEQQCFTFPLKKDIPYFDPNTNNHVLTIRVEVSEKPDASGRVGKVSIVKPHPQESDFDFDRYSSVGYIWNEANAQVQKAYFSLYEPEYIKMDKESIFDWSRLVYTPFQDLPQPIKANLDKHRKELIDLFVKYYPEIVIGSEACIWAVKNKTFPEAEREATELSKSIEEAETPLDKIGVYNKHIQSYERLEHGILDAYPRQTLFDQTVSTMIGWVENDLAPVDDDGMPIIDSALANQLYTHIGVIQPELVKQHFLKMIRTQAEKKTPHWNWVIGWLNKYGNIKELISLDDFLNISILTDKPMTDFISVTEIRDRIEETSFTSEERKKAYIKYLGAQYGSLDDFLLSRVSLTEVHDYIEKDMNTEMCESEIERFYEEPEYHITNSLLNDIDEALYGSRHQGKLFRKLAENGLFFNTEEDTDDNSNWKTVSLNEKEPLVILRDESMDWESEFDTEALWDRHNDNILDKFFHISSYSKRGKDSIGDENLIQLTTLDISIDDAMQELGRLLVDKYDEDMGMSGTCPFICYITLERFMPYLEAVLESKRNEIESYQSEYGKYYWQQFTLPKEQQTPEWRKNRETILAKLSHKIKKHEERLANGLRLVEKFKQQTIKDYENALIEYQQKKLRF